MSEADRLHVLEPPGHLPYGGRWRARATGPIDRRRYASAVAREVRSLGWNAPILWTSWPVHFAGRVADVLRPTAHVLHATDSIWDQPWFSSAHERALRRLADDVDIAAAATPEIARRLRGYGLAVRHLPHGVDVDHFAPVAQGDVDEAPAVRALPTPRICFVGNLEARLDIDALVALADVGQLVLIGPSSLPDVATSRLSRAGAMLVGPVPYADLPAWLAGMHLATVPYRRTPLVESSRPLKLLEYLAAGLPVVATDIPAARELVPDVVPVTGPTEFRSAARNLLRERQALLHPEQRSRRLERVRPHSWAARAQELLTIFDEAAARRGERRSSAPGGQPTVDR